MPLYEMTNDAFRPIAEASLSKMNVSERGDLQRLLRTQIDVLDNDLYVLAEEFSNWEDSKRRIDLLAIDTEANLVVIELKRTHDGGHMELQAIRYASMVSAMTFERAVKIHGDFLTQIGEPRENAESLILGFLGWDAPDDEAFAVDVRITLVSEDFGKELTTAVLWLRDRDIDIRCVRLRPYQDNAQKMIDVQQIIPLPEAHDYQVQLKQKEQQGRKQKTERYELRQKFWEGVVAESKSQGGRHAHIKPGSYSWIGSKYKGLSYNFSVNQDTSQAELYIDCGDTAENKKIFDQLYAKRDAINSSFEEPLTWNRLDAKRASRVKYEIAKGGYRNSESEWQEIHCELVEAMGKMDKVFTPLIDKLDL